MKFLKNRMKTAKAAHQAIRQRHHQAWKANHEKVHKQLPGPVGVSGVDPQASTIQLWPPFSVANTVLPIQVRPSQSASGSIHPTTTMMSSVNSSSHVNYQLGQQRVSDSSMQHATQSMYSNLIPAYYIPPHVSAASQKPTGGYFVSVPTIFR